MADETPIYFIVEEPIAEETVVVDGERSGGDTGGGWGEPIRSRVDGAGVRAGRMRSADWGSSVWALSPAC